MSFSEKLELLERLRNKPLKTEERLDFNWINYQFSETFVDLCLGLGNIYDVIIEAFQLQQITNCHVYSSYHICHYLDLVVTTQWSFVNKTDY